MTTDRGKRPREPDEPATDGLTVLHRARIVPWSIAAVTCLSACPDGSVFAAGYEDGKVELFDANVFNRLAVIPGADGSEVSSLAWARAPGDPHWRLFAATLSGQLQELSATQLQPIASTDSYGGAIWCLRAAPCTSSSGGGSSGSNGGLVTTQLAAACGDGSVKLFGVSCGQPGAVFERSLPAVEGNVLALAWHPNGRELVSGGSNGCIHTWDVLKGTEQQRITVGTNSLTPPCVWALVVLPDGTIVSGDQEGAVQFWDARFGTLLQRHQQFVADVLTLVASPDGQMVWASGVDPKVAMYQQVPDKSTGVPRWAYLDRKQPHTHDVRALAALERPDGDAPLLLSGGNDGQVVLYSMPRFLKEHPIRQSKTPQRPLLQLSAGLQPAVLMQVQQRRISLWQLGKAAQQQPATAAGTDHLEGDHWDLATLPSQLASITTSSSSHIITAAMAPNASAVAAADQHKLRLFLLSHDTTAAQHQQQQQQVEVSRVKIQEPLDAPAVCCTFSADSQLLFAVTGTGHLVAVDAQTGEVKASQQLSAAGRSSKAKGAQQQQQQQGGNKQQQQQQQQQAWCAGLAWAMPAATLMAASPDGQLLAVATAAGVELFSTSSDVGASLLSPVKRLSLLGEPAAITALQFTPTSSEIIVATAANSLGAYSTATGLPTQWTLDNQKAVAEMLEALPGSIAGLSIKPSEGEPRSVLVYSAGGLCHVDMGAPLLSQPGVVQYQNSKQRKKGRQQNRPQQQQHGSGGGGVLPADQLRAEVGRNGRLLQLQHCCLMVGHISSDEALLLEKPWQEVLQTLLPPLYRHRYGS